MTKNLKFKIKNSQAAFTLIEAVVATSVFAFVIVSILGVYLSTLQLDRKFRAQRVVAENARFIMSFLAKEVRNGSISYASYASYPGGLTENTCFSGLGPCQDLYIQNQSNVVERIFFNGTDLVLTKNGASTNLNSAAVRVTNARFAIQPRGDPYTFAKTYNEQPHVTIVLQLTSSFGAGGPDTAVFDLETTFTTRDYPPRQ